MTRSMRLLELDHVDLLLAVTRGEQRGLVDEVRQVGAGEARRAAREHLEVDVVGERLAPRVDLQDAEAALEVGAVDDDLAVEAARAQQRRVEDVGAVGRRDEDDVVLDVEAVHLDEQLVERLLALVVTAAEAGAALAADRVDLVHEDDAGAGGLGLLEQVADARARRRRRTSRRSRSRRCEKNGTAASPATARASSVLPVPGGPTSRTPFGILAPSAWNLPGLARNSLISWSSSMASSAPATSLNVMRGWSRVMRFALALPKFMILELPPCIWLQEEEHHARRAAGWAAPSEMIVIHGLGPEASTVVGRAVSVAAAMSSASVSVADVGRRELRRLLLGRPWPASSPSTCPSSLWSRSDVRDLVDAPVLDRRRRTRSWCSSVGPARRLPDRVHDDPDAARASRTR